MRKPTIGTRHATNMAARKTPRSVCAGDRRQAHRQRLPARVAEDEQRPEVVLPRREHARRSRRRRGSAATSAARSRQNRRTGPQPSMRAASKISRGRLSKKRFISTTLNALAPFGQPDRPVAVDEGMVDERRVHDLDVERDEQHDRRDEQRRQQRGHDHLPVLRPKRREGVAHRWWRRRSGDPRAEREDDRVPQVEADVDLVPGVAQVAPGEPVREERQRGGERVLGRRDRRLGEPEDRAEADDHEQHEEHRLCRPESPPDARPAPVVVEHEAQRAAVLLPRPALERERDQWVLQERVARR